MPNSSWRLAPWRSPLWTLYRERLRRSAAPILIGPWRGEVGFEALYWLPFLDDLVAHGIARERLIPISRGGASVWYGTPRGMELYAMRTPRDVRIENRLQVTETGMLKQIRITPFDRAVLRDAASTLRLGRRYHVLHPAWMYHTLAPFWESERGLLWLARRTQWRVLEPPPLPDSVTLPQDFVAVRFYLRTTFRQSPLTQQLVVATIQKIASQKPVVVLHSDVHADDHLDVTISGMPNVTLLRDLIPLTPETNLAVQSAVLARSMAFVGTYGGFAQLALRFGRSVMSFFDSWGGTMLAHKHLADAMALQLGIPFEVFCIHELGFTQAILPPIVTAAKCPDVDIPAAAGVLG